MKRVYPLWLVWLALFLLLFVGCMDEGGEAPATSVPPTPTAAAVPTSVGVSAPADQNFIVVATDAPQEPFTSFNRFGEVTGLIADVLDHIAAAADLEFEFVVKLKNSEDLEEGIRAFQSKRKPQFTGK